MIIGLTGLKGSGKDTVAAYLIKEYGFERKAFTDPLKRSVAALFDIPFSDIDKLKNDPEYTVMIGHPLYDRPLQAEMSMIKSDMTFRELLQRYGTEAHRDVFGENFWLDHTLPLAGFYTGRKIVLTDVRFANEADRVRELGGTIWAIDRPGTVGTLTHDTHASEIIDFPVDVVIPNDDSIEALFAAVEATLSVRVI